MKFSKRILVVLAVVAMIVSCFAITSSADFTADNIEDVLEYYQEPTYVSESFTGLAAGAGYSYSVNVGGDEAKITTGGSHGAVEGENAYLEYVGIKNGNDVYPFGYSVAMANNKPNLVVSMKIKADKTETSVAPVFSINVYAFDGQGAPVGENGLVVPVTVDFNTGKVSYAKVSATDSGVFNSVPLSDFKVECGKWYTVNLIINSSKGVYSFSVIPAEGAAYSSPAISLGDAESVNELNARFVNLPENEGSKMSFDDVAIYGGSYLRGNKDLATATGEALVNLSALAATDIDVETKIRIAKVYEVITSSPAYVPTAITGKTVEEIKALYEAAKAYISTANEDAFVYSVSLINETRSYSRRLAQLKDIEYYMSRLTVAQQELHIDEVIKYQAEVRKLDELRRDSLEYITAIDGYDPENRTYSYILTSYDYISELKGRNGSYPGVYERLDKFTELETKRNEIVYNVTTFQTSVAAMKSPESDFITKYNSYLEAQKVFNGGAIHGDLDVATVIGLTSDIASYITIEAEISSVVTECEAFITAVKSAQLSTYYVTIKKELALAELYVDADKTAYTVEVDYPGVKEASDSIASIKERIAAMETAASAYIAAVNEISTKTTFDEKKAAVANAYTLKVSGDVIGIDGVNEANVALANIDATLDVLEGNSKTLLASVAALADTSLTLAERREQIIIANNAKDSAEPTYVGVAEAKVSLEAYVAAYNEQVAALNSAFGAVIESSNEYASANVNQVKFYKIVEIIKLLLN